MKGLVSILVVVFCVFARGDSLKCSACNMTIPDKARNHIILTSEDASKPPLHVCSLSCALKARKYDSKYSKVKVVDFNRPEELISGDRAYFLLKSSKIKGDLGELAMPPYFGAFEKESEVQAAIKKYGDGVVVQGFEKAITQ